MKPAAVFAIVLVVAVPALCHYLVREFWAASFLSALASGTVLGILVHGVAGTWGALLPFALGASVISLVPAFIIGIPFQNSARHREYRARYEASPAGLRKRIVLGTVAVAFGGCILVLIFLRLQSGSDERFPFKALLGGLGFVGIGAWQLIAANGERKGLRRDAT